MDYKNINSNTQATSADNENFNSGDTPKNPVYKPPVTPQPRKRRKASIVLAIVIPVVAFLLIGFVLLFVVIAGAFGFLHFRNKEATATVETIAVTEALTEAPTIKATEAPTEALTQKPTKTEEDEDYEADTFVSYKITLYPYTYIYNGPSYDYECVMTLDEKGIYTIVDECYDPASDATWGKLKSGAGWVNLSYNNQTENYSYSSYDVEPYLVTLYPPTYIYAGPGYEYDYVMTLEEQGVYTIVKEQYNPSTYSTWGKLKSGVGWINLG